MGAVDRRADFRRLARAALDAQEHYERHYTRGRRLPIERSRDLLHAIHGILAVLAKEHQERLRTLR